MTPAEYKTLREACGLSQQAAATFHDVAIRTIAHWENGRNSIPPGAADEIAGLNRLIETGVRNFLTLAAELREKHGDPAEVRLTRYRTAEDYAGSRADREGLPHACHNALIGRVLVILERQGTPATIEWEA